MGQDILNEALTSLRNAERVGKDKCNINATSNLIIRIFKIFQKYGYIGDFEVFENIYSKPAVVKLTHKINECKVIKPRFYVKYNEIIKKEMRYLPARDVGLLIISTSQGVMSNREAKEKKIGGSLLCYVY